MRLTEAEVRVAAYVGLCRLDVVREHRLRGRHGERHDTAAMRHVNGCYGEAFVAKTLDRWWPMTIGTALAGVADIGDDIEVRHTVRHGGRLIVNPGDDPTRAFVLVTGDSHDLTVRGWLRGADAQREQYLTRLDPDRPATYAVPQSALCTDLNPLRSR